MTFRDIWFWQLFEIVVSFDIYKDSETISEKGWSISLDMWFSFKGHFQIKVFIGTLDGSNMGLNEKSIYFVCNKKSKSKQMAGSTKIKM